MAASVWATWHFFCRISGCPIRQPATSTRTATSISMTSARCSRASVLFVREWIRHPIQPVGYSGALWITEHVAIQRIHIGSAIRWERAKRALIWIGPCPFQARRDELVVRRVAEQNGKARVEALGQVEKSG